MISITERAISPGHTIKNNSKALYSTQGKSEGRKKLSLPLDGPSQVTVSQMMPANMLCCSGTWSHTAECSQTQLAWHKQWEKNSRNSAERGSATRLLTLHGPKAHCLISDTIYTTIPEKLKKYILLPSRETFCSSKDSCALSWHGQVLSLQAARLLNKAAWSHLRV